MTLYLWLAYRVNTAMNVSRVCSAGERRVAVSSAVRRQNAVRFSCQQEQDHIHLSQGKESESDSPALDPFTR